MRFQPFATKGMLDRWIYSDNSWFRLVFGPYHAVFAHLIRLSWKSTQTNPPTEKPMNDRDQRRADRLARIQTFHHENAADFAPASKAQALFTRIDSHLADLAAARAGQVPRRVSKPTLLDALWLDGKNIARTARSIDLTDHGFAAAYRLPDDPTEALITAHTDHLLSLLEDHNAPEADGGDTPAQKAAKAALRTRFVAYEMPPDFVEDLRADREALRQANTHNEAENQTGEENTAEIGVILAAAAPDVQQLDAIMHNKYSRDPAKLHAWLRAARVERTPSRQLSEPTNFSPGTPPHS
jgi:hypothetical protein